MSLFLSSPFWFSCLLYFHRVRGILIDGVSLFSPFCRLDIIESVLCGSLFPAEFSVSDTVKHWVGIFSGFDKVEVKAFEKMLEQKHR